MDKFSKAVGAFKSGEVGIQHVSSELELVGDAVPYDAARYERCAAVYNKLLVSDEARFKDKGEAQAFLDRFDELHRQRDG